MLGAALTAREQAIVDRLLERFPSTPVTAEVREVLKPKGPIEALHLTWTSTVSVDVERAFIAWPGESPRRIVEAIEAQLEIDGLTPAPYSAPAAGIRSRLVGSLRTPILRIASLATRERPSAHGVSTLDR